MRSNIHNSACSRCGYVVNLSIGSTEQVCPECAWPLAHSLPCANFFEFSDRGVLTSFVRTASVSLGHRRFWTSLATLTPMRPVRLVVFALLAVTVVCASFLLLMVTEVIMHLDIIQSAGLGSHLIDSHTIAIAMQAVALCLCEWIAALLFGATIGVWRGSSPARVIRCGIYTLSGVSVVLVLWMAVRIVVDIEQSRRGYDDALEVIVACVEMVYGHAISPMLVVCVWLTWVWSAYIAAGHRPVQIFRPCDPSGF